MRAIQAAQALTRGAQDAIHEDHGVRDRVQRAQVGAAARSANLLRCGESREGGSGAVRGSERDRRKRGRGQHRHRWRYARSADTPHSCAAAAWNGAACGRQPCSRRKRRCTPRGKRTASGAKNMTFDNIRPSDGATTFVNVSAPLSEAAAARASAFERRSGRRGGAGATSGEQSKKRRRARRQRVRSVGTRVDVAASIQLNTDDAVFARRARRSLQPYTAHVIITSRVSCAVSQSVHRRSSRSSLPAQPGNASAPQPVWRRGTRMRFTTSAQPWAAPSLRSHGAGPIRKMWPWCHGA